MSTQEDQNPRIISLFPGDDEPATPDEEFENFERSVEDEPSDVIVALDDKPPLGRSWAFNFGTPQGFENKPGGKGPTQTFGLDTLRHWIDKVMHTDRGAHPIHPPEYGVEGAFAMIGRSAESPEFASYEQRLREALLFHPRITDLTDFEVEIDPDDEVVTVTLTVTVDDETELPVAVTLP
jgi:hypothetical protein